MSTSEVIKAILEAELGSVTGIVDLIVCALCVSVIAVTGITLRVSGEMLEFSISEPPLGHYFVLALVAISSVVVTASFHSK